MTYTFAGCNMGGNNETSYFSFESSQSFAGSKHFFARCCDSSFTEPDHSGFRPNLAEKNDIICAFV